MAGNFKNYVIHDYGNSYITLVGSIGAAANGLCRFFWGLAQDRYGFKFCYYIMIIMNIVLSASLNAIHTNKYLFMLWQILTLTVIGGHFNCFPVIFSRLYGITSGGRTYAFILSAFGVATVLGILLFNFVALEHGFPVIFFTFTGLNVIVLITFFFFKEKPHYIQKKA